MGKTFYLFDAEQKVIELTRQHSRAWRNKPDSYWQARLLEEIAELSMSLIGEHKHDPETELTQIAAICTNWLEKRMIEKEFYGKD